MSSSEQMSGKFDGIQAANAEIKAPRGGQASGEVLFHPGPSQNDMRVRVRLDGVEPGPHGFHIHAGDACWADGEFVAGDHYNPYYKAHGGPRAEEHHLGDMGNVMADEEGRIDRELQFGFLAFAGPLSILQRTVVLHSGEDDLKSQPSGGAGDPIACGLIRRTAEEGRKARDY